MLAQLLPGARIGVRFSDDPGIIHERLLGWPSAERSGVISTVDDDEYVGEEVNWVVAIPLTGKSVYHDEAGEEDQVIAFEEPLEDNVIRDFDVRARRLARQAQREPGGPAARAVEPKEYVSRRGARMAVPAEGRASALRDRILGHEAPPSTSGLQAV